MSEEDSRKIISDTITKEIGGFASSEKFRIATGLPKSRSGKIMHCIFRKIAKGEMINLGDMNTLLDPGVVDEIKRKEKDVKSENSI